MTDLIATLDWRQPWWGLLALQPVLLWAFSRWRRHKLASYADPALMPWAVLAAGAGPRDLGRLMLSALAWLLLATTAAGPRLPLEEAADGQIAKRHAMRFDVVLDVSASMNASDVSPTRLARAKLELQDLFKRLQGERVGLIVYAGEAGLLSPATDDADVLRRMLDHAEPGLIAAPGSHLAAALQLAQRDLQTGGGSKAILLVTDAEADSLAEGAGEAARNAVQALKQAGIPLYVLGVGGTHGAPVPLAEGGFAEADGVQVVSRMAITSYAEFARLTSGVFITATDGDSDWDSLYGQHLAKLPADAPPPGRVRAWQELYAWCLAPALMLLLWLHLPRALPRVATLILAGLVGWPQNDALADNTLQTAWRDYQAKRHAEAQTAFERVGGYLGEMGAGAAAWRLRDFEAAQRHFGAALLLARTSAERTDALYNLGNAHYARATWATAIEAYRAVLQERPNDAKAQANLEWATKRLKQRGDGPKGKTDLRARMGFFTEGEINVDWDREVAVKEFERKETGTLIDKNKSDSRGAKLTGNAGENSGVDSDSRRLQSGLKKLELLNNKPAAMYQGMMKQDASGASVELRPW